MEPPKCRLCGKKHWKSCASEPVTSNVTSNPTSVTSNTNERQRRHRDKMRKLGRKPWLIEVTDEERRKLKSILAEIRD